MAWQPWQSVNRAVIENVKTLPPTGRGSLYNDGVATLAVYEQSYHRECEHITTHREYLSNRPDYQRDHKPLEHCHTLSLHVKALT